MEEDILLIDKPFGITSMDVIRRLRPALGIRKIGHAGTLDPRATGLMLVGVGPGTKHLAELIKLDKEYVAEIRIGEQRTTGDLEGDILDECPATGISEGAIQAALSALIGTHEYPVSLFSAIKHQGQPLYKQARALARAKARASDFLERAPKREMTVYEAELLNHTEAGDRTVLEVRFFVGSGTYIRSLAEAVGRTLGYPATLQSLRRTQVGEYRVEHAQSLIDFHNP